MVQFYERFLASGRHRDLKYLESNARFDLQKIHPNTRTLLLFSYPYRFKDIEAKLKASPYKVARYAWQRDYHYLLKEKLQRILNELSLHGRAVTDSAPLFERYWARRAGLGWVGKNGMLIDPETGSYFFIAALLVEEDFIDTQEENLSALADDFSRLCQDCTRCIDACPTSALLGDGTMKIESCISYQTIEKKSAAEYSPDSKRHSWIFGCDICQQVCPHNQTDRSYARSIFNSEHLAVSRIASGEDLKSNELKESAFSRRGRKKIETNKQAIDDPALPQAVANLQ